MIGIILSTKRDKATILSHYQPLADKYRLDLLFYSLRGITAYPKKISGLIYHHRDQTTEEKVIAIPSVNIFRNTSYIRNSTLKEKIKQIRRANIDIVNIPMREQANKLRNYDFLQSFERLKSHIPDTVRLSYKQLDYFLNKYNKVIIKPIYGSKGRRITVIEKKQGEYLIQQSLSKKNPIPNNEVIKIPSGQWYSFFRKTFQRPSAYLVQQWITFLTYIGRPFDMRAAVQKNGKKQWQLTSCVARAAFERGRITNLNQGGEMVSLSQIKLGRKKRQEIVQFALEIAKTFEQRDPWVADIGIDLAIDQRGKLWFIEANFCSQKEKWTTIYRIPFEYARAIYLQKT